MTEEQLNELTENKQLQESFKQWLVVNSLIQVTHFKDTRKKYFKMFKSAFHDGVNAHANGDYY